jgi:hypothetical protein
MNKAGADRNGQDIHSKPCRQNKPKKKRTKQIKVGRAGRQAGRQTSGRTGRQTSGQTGRQADERAGLLGPVDRKADSLQPAYSQTASQPCSMIFLGVKLSRVTLLNNQVLSEMSWN